MLLSTARPISSKRRRDPDLLDELEPRVRGGFDFARGGRTMSKKDVDDP